MLSHESFAALVGLDAQIAALVAASRAFFAEEGVPSTSGVLLAGPAASGKTAVLSAIKAVAADRAISVDLAKQPK